MSRWEAIRERYRVVADPLRSERKIELVALVLGLLLCLQLLYSGARLALASAPDTVAPAMDVLQVKSIQGPAGVATGQSDEIRARPLFWQGRRPLVEKVVAEAAPVAAKKEAKKLKGVKLLGVFGSGDTAGIIALVKKKKRRILQGESIEGWTLESVQPNRITLVDGGRREELILLPGKVVAAAPAPAPDSAANSAANKPPGGPAAGGKGAGSAGVESKAVRPPAPVSGRRLVRRAPPTADAGKKPQ